MLITLKRILKTGWKNLWKDGWPTAATVLILLIPIALIGSLLILREANKSLISTLQAKADISVYLKENIEEKDIADFKNELFKLPEVKEIKYISKEEALQNFLEKHKDNPTLIESIAEVGGNPFFPSIQIKALEASQYEAISGFLENSGFKENIEKVDYYQRKTLIDKIFSITSTITKIGISLFIVMVVISILISFNTIRLSILHQKEEIKIQRLVGASNWFIRGPFLVQGTISGIFATLICMGLFALIFWYFGPKIETFLPDLNLLKYFTSNLWILIPIQLVTGISLGIISSMIAIRKYLRV